MKKIVFLALAVALFALPAQASYLVTGSLGSLAASAEFTVLPGNQLQVVLTNTSMNDVLVPADVLTGVFFDVLGVGALAPVSAALSGGSTVLFGFPNGGGNVGGEWAYGSGLAGAPYGATEGISSAGFGLFGGSNFGGPDLVPPPAVDGLNYGLTSAGDNPATGNAAVTGANPLIMNQVTFTLSGLTAGFVADESTIIKVSFQYGTALTEPNIPPIPEPTTLLALGTGLLIVGAVRGRRNKR